MHPQYRQAVRSSDTVALIGFENAFVLTRDAWFARHLEISRDTIFQVTEKLTDSVFRRALQKHFTQLSVFPDSLEKTFIDESVKLSDHIFLKIKVPGQGQKLSADSLSPPFLLIIHEFIIGTDLLRENYFDYTLAQQESETRRNPDNLSLIMTYTLWDNFKQRALLSSAVEVQLSILGEPKLDDLASVTVNAVQTLLRELTGEVAR
ncbi:MAG: hypothetical protein LBR60_01020 [Fibrobacter sp.]|nr:hypothetical protein [Fibrobacter sp.]